MSIELELKELILNKYKSLREFSIIIDMPYSTLDTILKRGVNKANIVNIIKICKELNIDTEALGEGKIIFKNTEMVKMSNESTKKNNLSIISYEIDTLREKELINNFHKLNEVGQSEAVKRVEELTHIEKYTRNESYILNAAHEIEGASEEDKAHDDAIMDDDDF